MRKIGEFFAILGETWEILEENEGKIGKGQRNTQKSGEN